MLASRPKRGCAWGGDDYASPRFLPAASACGPLVDRAIPLGAGFLAVHRAIPLATGFLAVHRAIPLATGFLAVHRAIPLATGFLASWRSM